jgi:hypothetical protein
MAWTYGGIAAGTSYGSLALALEQAGNAAAAAEARAKRQELDQLARMRVQRANEESKSLRW